MRTVFEVMRIGRGGRAKTTQLLFRLVLFVLFRHRTEERVNYISYDWKLFFVVYRKIAQNVLIIFGQQDKNFLTHNISTFCPHSCICVFCVDLRTNSDYFPIQH
jgi:hypothetical protein